MSDSYTQEDTWCAMCDNSESLQLLIERFEMEIDFTRQKEFEEVFPLVKIKNFKF